MLAALFVIVVSAVFISSGLDLADRAGRVLGLEEGGARR